MRDNSRTNSARRPLEIFRIVHFLEPVNSVCSEQREVLRRAGQHAGRPLRLQRVSGDLTELKNVLSSTCFLLSNFRTRRNRPVDAELHAFSDVGRR